MLKPHDLSLIYNKDFFLQLFNDSVIFQLHKTKSFTDIFDWTVCSKHLLYYVARKNNPKELSCLLMCVHGKTYLENGFLPVIECLSSMASQSALMPGAQ